MQNINRELCRRLRRADNRIAELQMLRAKRMTPLSTSSFASEAKQSIVRQRKSRRFASRNDDGNGYSRSCSSACQAMSRRQKPSGIGLRSTAA